MVDRNARFAGIFGRVIRYEREKRHWTMLQLAARTGLSAQYISYLERGKHSPSIDSLLRCAYAFEMRGAEVFRIVEETLIAETPP
jgi:transcriptional regulator with XRE-family HTH domain